MVSMSPALAAGLPQTPSPRWYVDHKKLPQAGRRSLAAGCPPPRTPLPAHLLKSKVPKRRMRTRSAYPGSMAPGEEGAAPLSVLSGQPQAALASQRLQDAVLYAALSREGWRRQTRVRPQWVRQPGWARGA